MKYIKISFITILILAISLISILIFIISPLLGTDGFVMPIIGRTENILNENLKEFSYVADYFLKHKGEYIYWYGHEPEKISFNYDDTQVNDETVMLNTDIDLKQNIQRLKDLGVNAIIKIDNYVEFATWYSLDSGYGFIYCLNEKPKPEYNGETKIIETSVMDWYIYEHISD